MHENNEILENLSNLYLIGVGAHNVSCLKNYAWYGLGTFNPLLAVSMYQIDKNAIIKMPLYKESLDNFR